MIRIRDFNVRYRSGKTENHVVRGIDLTVAQGECVGIVGESGCGKSTLLRCLVGLESGWTGNIEIDGQSLGAVRGKDDLRRAQMVFQDPFGSLHPRHRIGRALSEPLRCMGLPGSPQRVAAALKEVGLPASFAHRFPHQLSGGQRQRVAIARALIIEPPILLLDEPTSALDVSVQAEILNLLSDRRDERGLTYLLVSHDLAVVAHMCDRILVMQNGVFVEELTPDNIRLAKATHPYAQHLMDVSLLSDAL
ncbi:ABC transporter ATP-binding protein [Roseinatronobacter alkalisoli]|uniref:Glutathione import ATP-binding protein GsiA n=1 Tax=Roseinatronobacter alkalisoli TaxID=3028235 RepID=A0ABT5TDZ5_9RHOB|nr:ABC transporter ATP-binding protein [Roseinatronobacter sp. HJB301]MDD7973343.1 ABC transporter ATP-binding protein [Roseinatronobacter sp. HJB301]